MKEEIEVYHKQISKLTTEFSRKVKSKFRGVNINIFTNVKGFKISIGSITFFTYESNRFEFEENIISKELAYKLKDLYIEYYGEF
jgi:hypothetical protein